MRRTWPVLLLGLILLAAVLVQVGLMAVLPIPGATPDLVLVVAATLAVARGPGAGALAGFAGGVLLDLVPPAAHPAGQWALVLTLVGYTAGFLGDPRLGFATRVLLVGLLAGLAETAYVTVSGLLGSPWPRLDHLAAIAVSATVYAAVLAAIVVPAGSWVVWRTAAPARTAW